MKDTAMLLIICYCFGILTAVSIFLMVSAPLTRARVKRAYMSGYMDGFTYGNGGDDVDY